MLEQWICQAIDIPYNHTSHSEEETFGNVTAVLEKIDGAMTPWMKNCLEGRSCPFSGFEGLLSRLQRYLMRLLCKKLKKNYLRQLLMRRNNEDLIAIVIYLALNSELSSTLVPKILERSQQNQRTMMQHYKQIDSNCQSLIGLREVVQKIQAIQQDNSRLKDLFESKNEELAKSFQFLTQLEIHNRQLAEQNQRHSQEQEKIHEQLDITSIKEFSEVCWQVKEENAKRIENILAGRIESDNLAKTNKEMKKELQRYGLLIKNQIEEVEKLKNWYAGYSQERLLKSKDSSQGEIQISLTLPLSDHTDMLNLSSMAKKNQMLTDRTHCSTSRENYEEPFETRQNLGPLLRLGRLQDEELQKRALIAKLKEEVGLQSKKMRRLDCKMQKIKREHNRTFSKLSTEGQRKCHFA